MPCQRTSARNGRQAASSPGPHSLHALVREQLHNLRALLDREDRALEQAHAKDVRYQLRLLVVLQQIQERLARTGRNVPSRNWP
jgi:hypothetical protein